MQASSVKVRANNLVVESLQDIVQERMSSMQMHIGFNKAGTYKELGGKAEVGKRDAAWTKAIGSIIGTQVTHVVVQQTLEIAGGLIANAEVNADGNLTDKGRLYVEAGSIIARQLHDYDNGRSFGLGATLTKKADSSGKLAWGVGVPVVCSFNEQSRDILPVIGSGEIKLTGGSNLPPELSRNVNSQIGITTGDKASLRATVPVSDMVEFINSQLQPKPIIPEVAKDIDKEELAEEVLTETQQVEAEQEKEAQQQKEQKAREVKQAKQNQQQEQAQQQKEQEELEALELSFKNYEEYSRTNYPANPQEKQTVEPNAESLAYASSFIEAKEQVKIDKEQQYLEHTYKTPVKLLDINHKIKPNEAKHCIVFIYDPSVNSVLDGKGEKKLELPKVPTGHYFLSLGKVTKTGCVKYPNQFYGMNPKTPGMAIDKGKISNESFRYNDVIEYERNNKTKISVEKAIPITEEQRENVINFIEAKKINPGLFIGHLSDCIEFSNDILKVIGLNLRIDDIIKLNETKSSLAKASVFFRSLDNKSVFGLSIEDVATRYNISPRRVIDNRPYNVLPDGTELPPFTIMPYEKYHN